MQRQSLCSIYQSCDGFDMFCHGQNAKVTWVVGAIALLIRWVTVRFVGVVYQGQSLRQPSAATVSLRLGHTRAQHYPRAASLPLHNGGVVRGHRLFGELPVGFVGEGVKRVLIVYAALSLSHLRCQLSPGESLGLSVLFVRCVTILQKRSAPYAKEGGTDSKASDELRKARSC